MEENRATGKTTRQVDNLVQVLFNNPNEEIIVQDHYALLKDTPLDIYIRVNKMLAEKVAKRIKDEHGHRHEVVIRQDRSRTLIKLK